MPLIPALERIIKQEETALNTQSHSEIPGGKIAISDWGRGKSQWLTVLLFRSLGWTPISDPEFSFNHASTYSILKQSHTSINAILFDGNFLSNHHNWHFKFCVLVFIYIALIKEQFYRTQRLNRRNAVWAIRIVFVFVTWANELLFLGVCLIWQFGHP